jgi:hypothetical protein
MTKQERVTFVILKLKELYPTIPIPLDHNTNMEAKSRKVLNT